MRGFLFYLPPSPPRGSGHTQTVHDPLDANEGSPGGFGRGLGRQKQEGQTLVALLAFMSMAIILTSAATAVTLVNSQAGSKYHQGQQALRIAESGADNALLRLLRDPAYSGETLAVGSGTATITVSGSGTKTIVSEGIDGSFRRRVQVTATLASNVLTITAWSEVP